MRIEELNSLKLLNTESLRVFALLHSRPTSAARSHDHCVSDVITLYQKAHRSLTTFISFSVQRL